VRLTHGVLLLLLLEHMGLLGLEVLQRVCVGAHAGLHHGTSLTDGAVGPRDVLHARGHGLAGAGSLATHGMSMRQALWVHAGIVRVAGGHHRACTAVWSAPCERRGASTRSATFRHRTVVSALQWRGMKSRRVGQWRARTRWCCAVDVQRWRRRRQGTREPER